MNPTHTLPTIDVAEATPADILRGAALYLQRHGWTQGIYYTASPAEFPPACPAGAIAMAICGRNTVADDRTHAETRLYNRTLDFFGDCLSLADPGYLADCQDNSPDDGHDLFGWNDHPGRTAAEVITALNAAADTWDRSHTSGGGSR